MHLQNRLMEVTKAVRGQLVQDYQKHILQHPKDLIPHKINSMKVNAFLKLSFHLYFTEGKKPLHT